MSYKKSLLSLAIAATFSCAAQAVDFQNIYFFGDSLTDTGAFTGAPGVAAGAHFTVNPEPNYADLLAAHYGFTAIPINPNNPNLGATGNNYAEGGARSVEDTRTGAFGDILDLPTQVGLAVQAGRSNPNSLYVVFSGGNDIPVALSLAATSPAAAQAEVVRSATGLVTQVATLKATGARYIIVPNLPNFAVTPAITYAAVQATLAQTPLSQAQQSALLGQAVPAMLAQLRASDDPATARSNAFKAAATILQGAGLPNLETQINGAYTQLAGGAQQLSQGFNLATGSGLYQQGTNAISVDLYNFINEVIANHAAYGIANVTGSACPPTASGAWSLSCTASKPGFDASKTYLFADDRHVTPTTNALIADYIESIVDAPRAVAPLADLQLAGGRRIESTIGNHLRMLDGTNKAGGGLRLFVDAGAARTDTDAHDSLGRFDGDNKWNATVGADVVLQDNVNVGLALTQSRQSGSVGDSAGKMESREIAITVYGRGSFGNAYIDGLGSVAKTDIGKIERNIKIGPVTRTETGSTSGDRTMFRLGGGYNLAMGMLKLTPNAGVTVQSAGVSAYQENSGSSTAMSFGNQNVKSTVASVGLAMEATLATSFGGVRPFVDVAARHEYEDSERSLTLGLSNGFTRFQLPVGTPDANYGTVSLGVNVDLGKTTSVGVNYNQVVGMDNVKDRSASISLSSRF